MFILFITQRLHRIGFGGTLGREVLDNNEIRSTNVQRVPARSQARTLSFGFRIPFVIRISSFVIHT